MDNTPYTRMSRRSLLHMIGTVAGSAAMYHAMTELGYAEESDVQRAASNCRQPPAGHFGSGAGCGHRRHGRGHGTARRRI